MSSLISKFRKWLRDRQDRQYLAQISGQELADLGLSSTDLQVFASSPKDTRQRMEAMAKAHGLAAEVLDNEHWRQIDMARACGQCGERDQCRRWLGKPDPDTAASDFCPNAGHFAELALMSGVSTLALNSKPAGDE